MSGLPDYRVRVSPRARRISLKVSARGVEVVLPKGAPTKLAEQIVRERREWIERQQARLAPQLAAASTLPEQIKLTAIDECWPIEYRQQDRQAPRLKQTRERLLITGDCTDATALCAALKRWLIRRARPVLADRLAELQQQRGERFGLGYRRVAVRCQRSRWGSYSSRGTLSLNASLLLLPPEQLDYVLLHELAHSRHPNHSAEFWGLLEQLCPGARQIDAAINRAARELPGWLLLD